MSLECISQFSVSRQLYGLAAPPLLKPEKEGAGSWQMCCQSRRLSAPFENSLYVKSRSPGLEVHMETGEGAPGVFKGNIFKSLSLEVVVCLSTRLVWLLVFCAQKLT